MNDTNSRRARAVAALSTLTLVAGCSFGMWSLYPGAAVQLPWAADLDRSETEFLVSDIHANKVVVLNKQGGLLASVPYTQLPQNAAVDHITRRNSGDHDWWALTSNDRLVRFVYSPTTQSLIAAAGSQSWLGEGGVADVCDIASGIGDDLFVAFKQYTRFGTRVVVKSFTGFGPSETIVADPQAGATCGQLAFDEVLRQVIYYEPEAKRFVRIEDDLDAIVGTTPMPPNSNSTVHDFVAGAGYILLGHVKVFAGVPKNYVTFISSSGSVEDSRLFQQVWALALDATSLSDAFLWVFGAQSNAKMHRLALD